jgi:hypothetical protein
MSTLRVNTLQNSSGVEVYTAKAWVNFNGEGTVAIRASGNVSSITDNGIGYYTVNFTNAMVDVNYSASVTARIVGAQSTGSELRELNTSSTLHIYTYNSYTGALGDASSVNVAIFR